MDQLELCDLSIGHASPLCGRRAQCESAGGRGDDSPRAQRQRKDDFAPQHGRFAASTSRRDSARRTIIVRPLSTRACSPSALLLTTRPAVGSLTVEDVLTTARLPHRGIATAQQDHAAIAQAAQRCGIEALMARPLHTLSDGQAQWVMLARALAQATPLLLLDEPTAHLDPPNKRALFALLFAVAQETGRTDCGFHPRFAPDYATSLGMVALARRIFAQRRSTR